MLVIKHECSFFSEMDYYEEATNSLLKSCSNKYYTISFAYK